MSDNFSQNSANLNMLLPPSTQKVCGTLRDLVPFAQLKNLKNTPGGELLLVLKVPLLCGHLLNYLNATQRIAECISYINVILAVVLNRHFSQYGNT